MKWITHQAGAALGALTLALPLPAVIAAVAGAIGPDIIDQKISALASSKKKRQRLFNKIHRGSSHWFGWWLALFLAAIASPLPPLLRDAGIGLAIGLLSHIILDLLTPHGVPLLPFTQKFRVALPICSTGKAGEYIFLFALLTLGAIFLQDALWQSLASVIAY